MKHKKLNYIKKWGIAVTVSLCVTSFSSCNEDSPDYNKKTTVLIYAVASNNLYGNLIEDKNEILEGAVNMDLSNLRLLVYQVIPNHDPELQELKKQKDGTFDYETIKNYNKSLYSTDPERISNVINDVRAMYSSDVYGLILWSHGTGIDPFNSTRSDETAQHPIFHSFGSDKDTEKDPSYSDQINIDELANAIPDNFFNYIWFDACYMSGIETLYELRNKCKYFVGYPTEVFTPGMPYNLTLPYLLADNPDLIGGANAFFNYYANHPTSSMRVATVCVVNMEKLEGVADQCKEIYSTSSLPAKEGLLKYTRGSIGPFYDFGQFTKLRINNNDNSDPEPSSEQFEEAFSELIMYSAATEKDFNYNEIDHDKFSGVSCYYYVDDNSEKAQFYKTLDWYKRVYE